MLTTATQTKMAEVLVNGEPRSVPVEQPVQGLLDWLGITGDRVAVELDKTLVRRRDWPNVLVREGAQIEIVEFVGGG